MSKPIKITNEKYVFMTNANKVNIRLGPSTSHPIVKTVNQNEKIEGRQYHSVWVQITSIYGRAFISNKYVKKVNSPEKIMKIMMILKI